MSTFRKQYRELTGVEKTLIENIKTKAEEMERLLEDAAIPPLETAGDIQASPRHIALAKTKLEECVMWAVKGITG